MARPLPRVGMAARIVRLGHTEETVIEEVRDGGRTVIAGGRAFTLRRLTGEYVAEGEPYYGVRLVFGASAR
jgi:hypothetical protein